MAIWHPTLTLVLEPSRIYERQVLKQRRQYTESKSMPSVTNRCLDELQMLICVNVNCQKTLVIIECNHFHIAIWHPTLTLFFEPSRIYERQVLKRFDCREVLTSLVMNQKSNMTKTTIPSRTKQSSGMKSGISKAMKRR